MPLTRPARILVIDGDNALSSSLRAVLEGTGGYQVEVETQAQVAANTAREFRPDLVLLDLNLAGMDCAQFAAQLRTDPLMRNTRILFLRTMTSPGQQGFRNGAYYLAKPVQPAMLLQAIGSELVSALA